MKIGIDQISFYVPKFYLDLKTLAHARGVDHLKYTKGLLTNKMSVAPFNEDIITLAAQASLNYLTKADIEQIDLVLFTTESGLDYSKSAATHLISILGLRHDVRAIEMKQACYATTAALYFAKGHILQNPQSKVLILASDIAKYGLEKPGEPTQGAGAVSILVSKDPKVMILEDTYSMHADDIYDFWRPTGEDYAHVNGQFSNEMYKQFFLKTFESYKTKTNHTLDDFGALTFHIPYAKLGLRSLQLVADEHTHTKLFDNFYKAITYNKEIGNIYTGSLFLSVIAILEYGDLKSGERIGMFAYGSGAVAEFFTGTLVPGYKKHLHQKTHQTILQDRVALDMPTYEKYLTQKIDEHTVIDIDSNKRIQLEKIENYQRKYLVKL